MEMHEILTNHSTLTLQLLFLNYNFHYYIIVDIVRKKCYSIRIKCDLTFVTLIFYIYSSNGQYLNIIITMYSFKL